MTQYNLFVNIREWVTKIDLNMFHVEHRYQSILILVMFHVEHLCNDVKILECSTWNIFNKDIKRRKI